MERKKINSEEYRKFKSIPNPHKQEEHLMFAEDALIAKKNRFNDIIPTLKHRVILNKINDIPNSDYINADRVYPKEGEWGRAHILTQAPMKNTLFDFMRMIWEQNSSIVICLHNMCSEGEDYLEFEGTKIILHPDFPKLRFSLERRGCREEDFIEIIECRLVSESAPQDSNSKSVNFVRVKKWEDFSAIDVISTLKLASTCYKLLKSADDIPIIHCRAGVGRAGTFSCILRLYEMYKDDKNLPRVSEMIQVTRKYRREAVQSFEQFILIKNMKRKLLEGEKTDFLS